MTNRKWLVLCASILIVLLLSGGTILALALQDGDINLTTYSPSKVLNQIHTAEVKGTSVSLDNDGLNQLLAVFLERLKKTPPLPGLEVNGLNGAIDGSLVIIRASTTYRGIPLLVSVSGMVSSSIDNVLFEPQTLEIGKLSIPTRLALALVRGYHQGEIAANSNALTLKKSIVPFGFSNLSVNAGKMEIGVQPLPAIALNPLNPNPTKPSSSIDKNTAAQPLGLNTPVEVKQPTSPVAPSPSTSAPTTATPPSSIPAASLPQIDNQAKPPSTSVASASTPPEATPPNQDSKATTQNLSILHRQLNLVMAEMSTAGQREIIGRIQASVGRTIDNPSHNFVPEAQQVKTLYYKLTNDERTAIKLSILANIDAKLIYELRTTYGI